MPEMDGWAVLDALKQHPETQQVAVHVVTEIGGSSRVQGRRHRLPREASIRGGARGLVQQNHDLHRPTGEAAAIVEDDESQRSSIIELISHEDVEITAVGSAPEALDALHKTRFDCMVLDLGLAGGTMASSCSRSVKADRKMKELPIIIYTRPRADAGGGDAPAVALPRRSSMKDVKSPERLLDEFALFLHRVEARLPEQKTQNVPKSPQHRCRLRRKAHPPCMDDDVETSFH